MKGQGSTEYLVILAVVLVVALIVIGLLGQFTGFGSAGLEQQSNAYWQGATPFSISNAKIANSTGVSLEVQNKLSQKLTLTAVSLDGDLNITSTAFAPGQDQVVNNGTAGTNPCAGSAAGTTYQVNKVIFTYNVAGGITGQTQTGDKSLYGKCS